MHDPLQTVRKLRSASVDAARMALTASLEAVTAALATVRHEEQEIANETERASDPNGGDELVEAFALWLPGARARAGQARLWHDRQEAEVARCRADLAASRTALESVEQLIQDRRSRRLAAEASAERQMLDEAAARRKPGVPG